MALSLVTCWDLPSFTTSVILLAYLGGLFLFSVGLYDLEDYCIWTAPPDPEDQPYKHSRWKCRALARILRRYRPKPRYPSYALVWFTAATLST